MMKKLIAITLALTILLSLAACGGEISETEAPATESTQAPTEAPQTTPPTSEPTEAPTEKPTVTCPPVEAATDEEAAAAVAQNFFNDYITMTYLYYDTDIETHTTLALDEAVRQQIAVRADTFSGTNPVRDYEGYVGEALLTDHAGYQIRKFLYMGGLREGRNTRHQNLERTIEASEISVAGDYARVEVSGGLGFRYDGEEMDSFVSEDMEVFLFRYDGAWYVFDAFDFWNNDDDIDPTRSNDFDAEGAVERFLKRIDTDS